MSCLGLFAVLGLVVVPSQVPVPGSPPPGVRISITGASETPHLWASLGVVSAPRAVGSGVFEAFYTPPASGPPAVALLAAWNEGATEVATASVRIEARMEIPIETEPYAHVTVAVGERRRAAHADAAGHARVMLSVPPGVSSVRLTAEDAAGNTTVRQVPLELPPAERLWLIAPPTPVRGDAFVLALALDNKAPRLTAEGAQLTIGARPGVAIARFTVERDVRLTASVPGAERSVLVLWATGPSVPAPAPSLASPRWELGASIGPRYSGAFVGAALALEGRIRLGARRLHLGLDLAGIYSSGSAQMIDVEGGGVVARVVFEARFGVAERVALILGAGAGGAAVGERRTLPSDRVAHEQSDGGPSLSVGTGIDAKLGPGLLGIRFGFAWTPMVHLGLTNLEGGFLSLGYRAARW